MSYYVREPEDVPRAVELFRMNYERLPVREEAAADDDLVEIRTTIWGKKSYCLILRRRESLEGWNHGTTTAQITAKLEV